MIEAPAYKPDPDLGHLLWCRFPQVESIQPGPKPRPALVTAIDDGHTRPDQATRIRVVYGTGSFQGLPRPWEFDITPDHGLAFTKSGLAKATRFNCKKAVWLPFNELWFQPPPLPTRRANILAAGTDTPAPHLGVLSGQILASVGRALRAAGL